MVLVHIEIPSGGEFKIEPTMMREKFEHVIKESDSGRNFITSSALDSEPKFNAGLFGCPVKRGFPHRATFSRNPKSAKTSRSEAISRALCSRVPRVMRTQSWQP